MARSREFDEEQVADALLQTFWERGYAGTSMPNLISATGLGPGSLYAAFGNKEAMFQIAVDQYCAFLSDALESETSGLEGIRVLLNKIVRHTAQDPDRRGCLVINAIPESKALSKDTQKILKNVLRDFRKTVRQRLGEALNNSTSQDDTDLDSLAASLASTVIGIRVLGRAGMGRKQLQAIADGTMTLIDGYFNQVSRPHSGR